MKSHVSLLAVVACLLAAVPALSDSEGPGIPSSALAQCTDYSCQVNWYYNACVVADNPNETYDPICPDDEWVHHVEWDSALCVLQQLNCMECCAAEQEVRLKEIDADMWITIIECGHNNDLDEDGVQGDRDDDDDFLYCADAAVDLRNERFSQAGETYELCQEDCDP